ncbi:MAG: cation diffusion facilitator family transporter [Oscillospiraceae bacterium]|jgi:cation diffusion facilitator family transporter|nr:cation diffusion facilitator family transporter [Oscillospiraceae bacterium]
MLGLKQKERDAQILKVGVMGVCMNLLLVLIKLAIGKATNSVALICDSINNLMDAGAAIVSIVGAKLASRLPTKKHPYGYGRIEYIAGLIISIAILVCGLFFLKESVIAIAQPKKVHFDWFSILGIAFGIVIKIYLWWQNKQIGIKINSHMLKAVSIDALADVLIASLTLVIAAISSFSDVKIDGYMGVFISMFVIHSGLKLIREMFGNIIGMGMDKPIANKIYARIMQQELACEAHDLIFHNYGPEKYMGSVEVGIKDYCTIKEVSDLFARLRSEIEEEFGILMTFGIYSTGDYDEELFRMEEEIKEVVKKFEPVLGVHAFSADKQAKKMHLDVVADFQVSNEQTLKAEIVLAIGQKFEGYDILVHIDREYI